MKQLKQEISEQLLNALRTLASDMGQEADLPAVNLLMETPPKPELGDLSFPMFPFAKVLKMPPPAIATKLTPILARAGLDASAMGPYINIRYDRAAYTFRTMANLRQASPPASPPTELPVSRLPAISYGSNKSLAGEKIVIEFSSPNTNKPMHLGHLRNNALGESLSRILRANAAEVRKVNLINDRGIHICKSMLAYKEKGEGRSPADEGLKPDHFVGKYYVIYNDLARKDPDTEGRAQEMLRLWEAGDPPTLSLWKTMNAWAMEGLLASYERTGIHFDTIYYESNTYKLGKDYVLKGLREGLFYKDDGGAILIDLDDIALDKKVLLRGDGTSVYITQDIGTAIQRHKDWPFDRMFYVVANEQNYHFRVLFHVLGKLGLPWAGNLAHISYGMVNLPEGKMKSREGTIVDADNLLDELQNLALQGIQERGRDSGVSQPQPEKTAEALALAAVNYYLLQVSPTKDMIFNPGESLSFTGNTGPYLQYTGARISSIFRRHVGADNIELPPLEDLDWALLSEEIEWELVKIIARFPDAVETAGREYDPSIIAVYLYNLGKTFSRFYHEHPVLNCPRKELRDIRLYLARAVREVLREGCYLINIPFLEKM